MSECLQFLSARAPKKVVQSEKSGFTHDIICTILSCLQSYITIRYSASSLIVLVRVFHLGGTGTFSPIWFLTLPPPLKT